LASAPGRMPSSADLTGAFCDHLYATAHCGLRGVAGRGRLVPRSGPDAEGPPRTHVVRRSAPELAASSTFVSSPPAPGRRTGGRDDEYNAVADKKGQAEMAGREPVDAPCNCKGHKEAACVQQGELPARKLIQPLVHAIIISDRNTGVNPWTPRTVARESSQIRACFTCGHGGC
jgi:hypothetical protein